MRVVVSAELGAGPSLAELETPTAGPGEVRVKAHSSSLNGFDSAVVSGYTAAFLEHRFPVVLGRDFSGRIDQIGPEVTGLEVGEAVFGVILTVPLHAGGFGEYVVVPQGSIIRVPEGMDLATAGVIGLAGSAANTIVDTVAPSPGYTMLISGATGGVGNILIQLATERGATVLATAAPGAETELVQRLGAKHVIDYTADVPAQVRAIAPDGLDCAVHLAGDPFGLADLLVPFGKFVTLLGVGQEQMGERNVIAHSVNASLQPAQMEDFAKRVLAGEVIVPVQRTYSLAEVPQAFADFGKGTMGKLAITIEG